MKKRFIIGILLILTRAYAAEFAQDIVHEAADLSHLSPEQIKAYQLTNALRERQSPQVIQAHLTNGVQPDSFHVAVATRLLHENTPAILTQLLRAGAPIDPLPFAHALLSPKAESMRVFQIVLNSDAYTQIAKSPEIDRIVRDANNFLQWGKTTPAYRTLLLTKLKLFDNVSAQRRARALPQPLQFTYDFSAIQQRLPNEILLNIMREIATGDTLEDISKSIAQTMKVNTVFRTSMGDAVFTERLIKDLAQGPAKKFLASVPSPLAGSLAEQAAHIVAAATIHTPHALQWLARYLQDPAPLMQRREIAQYLLVQAATTNNTALIDSLLRVGVDPNSKNVLQSGYGVSESALAAAAAHNSLAGVTMLLEKGADPNLGIIEWKRPLQAAVKRGSSAAIIKVLLDKGAIATFPNGKPLLITAIERGAKSDIETIRILLNSPDLNLNSKFMGQTVLDIAMFQMQKQGINPAIINELRSRGALTTQELALPPAVQQGVKRRTMENQ